MRIAHVYPAFHRRGGVERYLWELTKVIPCEQTIFASDIEISQEHQNIKVVKISLPLRWEKIRSLIFSISAWFKVKKDNFDFVIAHGVSAFNADIVFAHSVHKTWFLQSLRVEKNFKKKLLKLLNPIHYVTILIETIQYKFCSTKKIIAVSQSIKHDLIRAYGIPGDHIETIYSGVNSERFHPAKRENARNLLSKQFQIDANAIWFLFVANEFARKGLNETLQAFAKCGDENSILIIVGRDDPKDHQKLSNELAISDRCYFIGTTSEVENFFNASDVFVLPTRYEAFGLVISEAMASGLTVITTKRAGAAELIQNEQSGLLIDQPEDIQQLVKFMQFSKKAENRKLIGANARLVAEQNTWQHVSSKLMKLLQSLCS